MKTPAAVILIAAAALLAVETAPRPQPGIAREGDGHAQTLRISPRDGVLTGHVTGLSLSSTTSTTISGCSLSVPGTTCSTR